MEGGVSFYGAGFRGVENTSLVFCLLRGGFYRVHGEHQGFSTAAREWFRGTVSMPCNEIPFIYDISEKKKLHVE